MPLPTIINSTQRREFQQNSCFSAIEIQSQMRTAPDRSRVYPVPNTISLYPEQRDNLVFKRVNPVFNGQHAPLLMLLRHLVSRGQAY